MRTDILGLTIGLKSQPDRRIRSATKKIGAAYTLSAKNPHALFEVFAALRGRITRLVVGIVPPKEVEDIVQETYVRVCQIENKDTIREPHSFMFRTARNLALDYLKRAETRLTSGVDAIDEIELLNDTRLTDTTYAEASSDEEFSQFCDAVRHLPQQCRRAFVLKKVYGYSLREIAADMGLQESTVRNYIIAGSKKCMQYRRDLEAGRLQERGTSRTRGRSATDTRRRGSHE